MSQPVPDQRHSTIRVLIVDDSAVARGALGRVIDAEPDMCVTTTATNGRDALDALRQQRVDVVLLDVEMPVMDGFTALPLIVQRHPEVSVLVTSSVTTAAGPMAARALALGAVDCIHKPTSRGVGGLDATAAEITAKVRAAVQARGERAATPAMTGSATHSPGPGGYEPRILAIAASTGGPNALVAVISRLQRNFPIPIVITQHMPPIFTTMFAQRLARHGELPCEEVADGTRLLPGHAYVAPGDHHLTVSQMGASRFPTASINRDPPENHCRPAADPMFRSLARDFGSGVLAVVLTGMGEDGRQGCEAIVRAGGRVIVQDRASSVVWGMPGSVVNAGIPCTILPLHSIASHVASLCSGRP